MGTLELNIIPPVLTHLRRIASLIFQHNPKISHGFKHLKFLTNDGASNTAIRTCIHTSLAEITTIKRIRLRLSETCSTAPPSHLDKSQAPPVVDSLPAFYAQFTPCVSRSLSSSPSWLASSLSLHLRNPSWCHIPRTLLPLSSKKPLRRSRKMAEA